MEAREGVIGAESVKEESAGGVMEASREAPGESTEEASFFANKLKGLLQASDGNGVLTKRKTKRMKEIEEVHAMKKKASESMRKKAKLNQLNLETPKQQDVVFEQRLRKVATQGVVALFNAIKKYQQVNTTSKGLDDGSADVTKDGFLDMLKKGVEKKESPPTAMKQKSVDTNRGQKGGEDKTAVWKALRDDYLMGADLKNIDSGEDDSEASGDEDIDFESEQE